MAVIARVLPLLALSACSTSKLTRVQHVSVETDPPGAVVFQEEKDGERNVVGKGPVTVDREYAVKVKEFSQWCWATPVAGAVGLGLGMSSTFDDSSGGINAGGFALTVVGANLLAFGGIACTIGVIWAGEEEPETERLAMVAAADGRGENRREFELYGPDVKLNLMLPYEDGYRVSEALARRRADLEAKRATAAGRPVVLAAPPVAAPKVEAPAVSGPALVAGSPQPAAWALVIGVERYRDLPPPPGARSDAVRFADLARTTLGVPPANVRVILDDRATRGDVEKELDWLATNVRPGGRIYLYFAGHGAPDPSTGKPFLVPYDGDPKVLERTALPLAKVLSELSATKAVEVVAFLDSCFSGAGGRSVLPEGTRPLVPVAGGAPAAKVSVYSAASGPEVTGTDPETHGGLFTRFLIEGLGLARADVDGDGQVTLKELDLWATPRVARAAKADSRDQNPSLATGSGASAGIPLAYGVRPR